MKIQFLTEGDYIAGVKYDSENHKKVNKVFHNLTIELPAVPFAGQHVCLAKDGLELAGTVFIVDLNWFAKGNGLYENDETDDVYYTVTLKDMELVKSVDDSIFDYD